MMAFTSIASCLHRIATPQGPREQLPSRSAAEGPASKRPRIEAIISVAAEATAAAKVRENVANASSATAEEAAAACAKNPADKVFQAACQLTTRAAGAHVIFQKVHLLSRSASVNAQMPTELPKRLSLRTPHLLMCELGSKIDICDCTVALSQSQRRTGTMTNLNRRLCVRRTCDHPEYSLLLAMNAKFVEEQLKRGVVEEYGAYPACMRECTTTFILGPRSAVFGYMSLHYTFTGQLPLLFWAQDQQHYTFTGHFPPGALCWNVFS